MTKGVSSYIKSRSVIDRELSEMLGDSDSVKIQTPTPTPKPEVQKPKPKAEKKWWEKYSDRLR